MTSDNRRQNQFPDRGPAVQRIRGFSGWGKALSGAKSALQRLEAAQKQHESAQARRGTEKTGAKSGAGAGSGVFKTLVLIGAVLYGVSQFSEELSYFADSLGDIESFISGNGDELVDRLMGGEEATVSRTPKPSVPANRQPSAAQKAPEPPAPPTSPIAAPLTRISDLPHYPGAEAMLEDETVGVYVTTDPVPKVANATRKLLEDAGWQGRLTAQDPEMRHLTFTRGSQELTAYISVAPRLGNRTSIQYHIVK